MPSLPVDSIPIHAAENLDPSDQATFPRHLTLEGLFFRGRVGLSAGASELDGSSGEAQMIRVGGRQHHQGLSVLPTRKPRSNA
jgi:hypothetical protein